MEIQHILTANDNYRELDEYFLASNVTCLFLTCGDYIKELDIFDYLVGLKNRLGIRVIWFSEFSPNPQYESVVKGVHLFLHENCDGILAVGGGSAMDVAKCVKLFAGMKHDKNYLDQPIVANNIPLFAIPTTAGTGSEATRFAVIYYKGEKQSIAHESCIPSVVLFQEKFLKLLPEYQKKATMLDALCHGIESFWSINSTDESKKFSKEAISLILANKEAYLNNNQSAYHNMLLASYLAGKAINITQTTAGHAMCYKLTSLYGIAHGHAAALCVRMLWFYMIEHMEQCVDMRGQVYLKTMFLELAKVFEAETIQAGAEQFDNFVSSLYLEIPVCQSENEFCILKNSVNTVRLKNNPISLSIEEIDSLYRNIVHIVDDI